MVIDAADKIQTIIHEGVVVLDLLRELVVLSGIGDGVSSRKAWTVEEVYDEFLLERANAGDKGQGTKITLPG